MYSLLFYSPTGNTKYLAKQLKDLLDIEDSNISALEFLKTDELNGNEHLILMYPIHGFNPPRTVKRFVKNLPPDLFKKVSLIAVGCNNLWLNDAVSLGLRKQLNKKGYEVILDEILSMPLTFVMDFPKDAKIKTIEKAEKSIIELSEQIKEKIQSDRKVKLKSKTISTIGKLEDPAARLFGLELHAKKNCISCGICWDNCPEYNIKQSKKDKPKIGFKCSMCMRCIYDCPVQAITPYISKFITIKNGYSIEEKE